VNSMERFLVAPGLQRCVTVCKAIVITPFLFWSANGNAADGDWLTLYPTEVEALISIDRIDRQNSGDNSYHSLDYEREFGVSLSQEGYVSDPDLAWFQLNVEPSITREDTETNSITTEEDGDELDYLLQISLLQETTVPVGFDVEVQNSTNLVTGSLGSRYDNVINSKQASVDWKTKVFPMSLTYREELLEQDFRSSLSSQISSRDEDLQSWVIQGGSSKLDLRLEQKTLDDRVVTRDNDFELSQGHINHWLPWGRKSELRSRLNYSDNTGYNPYKRLSLDETARIQHTDNTFSRTSYRYYSLTQNIETVKQLGKFELHHNLYNNLTTIASVEVDSTHSESLDEKNQLTDLRSQYHKQDLFGANVNAGLGISYELTDRDSNVGLVDVVDESYVVPLGGEVTLNTRFILTSSIIVTNADSTLVYGEGLDYNVIDLVNDLTEIQIIPGGQINEGETIRVTYQADSLPSQEFSTTQARYNFGIDLGWIQFSHSDSKSNDSLISGADESFLNDSRITSTGIEFRWNLINYDIFLGAERRFILSGGFESTIYTYRQTFSWIYSSDARWNLHTIESFTQQDDRERDLYSLDLSLDWRPLPSLSIRPTLGFWKRQSTEVASGSGNSDDEFMTAGFTLHWNYRQVVMNFSYFRNQRTTLTDPTATESQLDEDRVMFKLVRRFL